ncbi:DUF4097 family beta strand repeat protein [Haloferax sp. MBLA0076]|uniref:DUF4097 family beta strand repeat protein n=1 Tax=Haloferax litoreum TaxID=2666140 RepID=A0A6A8GKL8_9EURY|nr:MULTISPECIES: DUF4097 family beta strand repeat-containing protein [Haloferax]KAB1194748.1 DUF4097 domain-containing protein [Haloferax sp. CBA1148]MRX23331.1 DUF4097 family beta strand repeat protein [Haloferax litoreum]
MNTPSRRSVLKHGGVLGLAALAGCAAPSIETREEETQVVQPSGYESLEVRNVNGSVRVQPWNADEVEVHIVKRAFFTDALGSVQVDIGGDDTLEITRVVRDEDSGRVVVDIEVRVPSDFPVTHASSSNGSIDVQGTTGDLEARTSNGSVTVRRLDGFAELTTSNGSITAFDVSGLDGVRTTNGSIEVDVRSIRDDTSIETSNGSVAAALAGDLDAELVAQTATGSIDTSGLSLTGGDVSRTRVTGTLGDGGPTLTVSTSNGSIELSLL